MCMTAHLQRRTNNFLKFNRKAHRTKNLNIKPLTTFIYKFSEDSFFFFVFGFDHFNSNLVSVSRLVVT